MMQADVALEGQRPSAASFAQCSFREADASCGRRLPTAAIAKVSAS